MEEYSRAFTSGSFGRLEAGKILGDATGIQSSLPYPSGVVSSSAQIASNISGSFTALSASLALRIAAEEAARQLAEEEARLAAEEAANTKEIPDLPPNND